jgi:hypothetical protein
MIKLSFNVMMFALFLFFLSLAPYDFEKVGNITYQQDIASLIVNGRPISVLISLAWLISNLKLFKPIMRQEIGYIPIIVLWIHSFLNLKSAYFGFYEVAILNIFIILFEVLVIVRMVSFFTERFGTQFLIRSIILYCALLVFFNFYLLLYEPIASYINGERLTGSCANPQHLMLNLSLIFPIVLIVAIKKGNIFIRILSTVLTLATAFLILQTGSRTGLGALVLIALLAIYMLIREGRFFILSIIFLAFASTPFFIKLDDLMNSLTIYFLDRGDTRTYVWLSELERFSNNPVFGAIPNEFGKFNFSESLWLSFLANGGLIVAVMLLLIIFLILRLFFKLLPILNLKNSPAQIPYFTITVVTFLSVFEAVFAGTYTAFAFISFVYFNYCHRILKQNKFI